MKSPWIIWLILALTLAVPAQSQTHGHTNTMVDNINLGIVNVTKRVPGAPTATVIITPTAGAKPTYANSAWNFNFATAHPGKVRVNRTGTANVPTVTTTVTSPAVIRMNGPVQGGLQYYIEASAATVNPVPAAYSGNTVDVYFGITLALDPDLVSGIYTGTLDYKTSDIFPGTTPHEVPGSLTVTLDLRVSSKIELLKLSDLQFGGFFPPSVPRSAILAPDGTITANGLTRTNVTTYPAKAARFKVTGLSYSTVSIGLPTSCTLSNGTGSTMTATNFNSTPSGSFGLTVANGYQTTVGIGATLNIGANQALGNYRGNFSVIFTFQ